MIANIRTQPRLTLKDVDSTSTWTNGLPWMTLDCKNVVTQTIEKINLNQQEKAFIENEIHEKQAS